MGRLSLITYTSEITAGLCDSSTWSSTTRNFVKMTVAEYGIAAGHWKQTLQTGNGRATTVYDAQFRPVLAISEDLGNTLTRSFVVNRYDSSGRPIFASYAVGSLGTVADATLKGVSTVYDALGRTAQVRQDSELSGALNIVTTSTEYLAGFQTRVTNPRGFSSTTSYQAFDSPSHDAPVWISAPENAYTAINRNVLGKPKYISRTGTYQGTSVASTRSYVYDANERLCKTINPEAGSKLVAYDAAGNLAWSVDGKALPGLVCDLDSIPLAERTLRAYDVMNRVVQVTTPTGAANLTTRYFDDGAVASVSAANAGGGPVLTSYAYNRRRMLVSESSANDTTLFSLGYSYNPNGHLSTQTYPDGQSVSYEPNALGWVTRVASTALGGPVYASAISYYPTGAISGFTFGNGMVHSMVPNARQLPARSIDAYGTAKVLDDTYTFDANGNVVDITDQAQNGLTTRGMAYDGQDRLTAAVSPMQWGNAIYAYDPLDNLKVADQGSRQHRYSYDQATNRLVAIKNSAGTTLITLGYDPNGNTTTKNSQAFQFDSANRMTQVTGREAYRYDGLGRRVQTTDSDGKTTFWIYSQSGQVVYTSEARRSQNLSYIYLGNSQIATRAVAWGGGAISLRFQHTDALGSPVAESDALRNIVKRNSYAPYGEAFGATVVDGTGYTGHVMDRATGLVYMQQRYYDPQVGRFLSVDPIASDMNSAWNFNRYNYAANSPYKFKDPDGRIIETVWDVANVVMDVASLGGNLAAGNYGGAAVDAGGLLLDLAATALPGVPGGAGTAIKMARVADMARGRASEARKLAQIGATKNTTKVATSTGDRIRDGTKADGTHVEIKDTKRLDNTAQLRGLDEAAGKAGKKLEIHTGMDTKISGNINSRTLPNTVVKQWDDLGPSGK